MFVFSWLELCNLAKPLECLSSREEGRRLGTVVSPCTQNVEVGAGNTFYLYVCS